jgi:hypothetical protein
MMAAQAIAPPRLIEEEFQVLVLTLIEKLMDGWNEHCGASVDEMDDRMYVREGRVVNNCHT